MDARYVPVRTYARDTVVPLIRHCIAHVTGEGKKMKGRVPFCKIYALLLRMCAYAVVSEYCIVWLLSFYYSQYSFFLFHRPRCHI